MDRKVKEYLESGKALQRKFDLIKFGRLTKYNEMVETFKPITESLHTLNENVVKSNLKSSVNNLPPALSELIASGKKYDKCFGIRVESNGLYVGNSPVTITPGNDILLDYDQSMYKGTPGLWELLTSENPHHYDARDMCNYERILLRSYAYKRNNDPLSKYIKSSSGQKYLTIIRPILSKYNIIKQPTVPEKPSDSDTDSVENKTGSGLRKFNTTQPVEYVHWNSVDELIERLCHLWGEVQSGNTNPLLLNEIVNIIQEFKEL